MYRIWCERELPARFARLLDGVAEIVPPGSAKSGSVISTLHGAHGVVAAARTQYDGTLMDRVPTLRVIARMGIGYDNVSLPDATARGVAVCNVPDGPTISTAEHAIMLLLATIKHLNRWQIAAREGGELDFFGTYDGEEVHGLVLGLIGLGRIGSRVAHVARALEMKVIAYDPFVPTAHADSLGVELASTLEDVLRAADVVSLHAPLSAETRHLPSFDEPRRFPGKLGAGRASGRSRAT
jgi:D-3-phosphoglycerate dehydrogenase / 2-oxoglutarate reductase